MTHARHRGFTMVELMISIALGLFILAGVGAVYVSGKRTHAAQEGMSRLQESGRFGTLMLQRTIRLAGYWNPPTANGSMIAFPRWAFPPGVFTIQGVDGATDTITVRFYGSDPLGADPAEGGAIRDCHGRIIQTGQMSTNTFFIAEDPTAPAGPAADRLALRCTSAVGANVITETLVTGVSNMQVLYGIDTTDSDSNETVNRYVTFASGLATQDNVRSVRITLTGNSMAEIDLPGTGATSVARRRIRQQPFVTTIALRNPFFDD